MTQDLIRTSRLTLLPGTIESLRADLIGRSALQDVLGIRVAEPWPPELYDPAAIAFTIQRLQQFPEERNWWFHYFVLHTEQPPVAVGVGGFKGLPSLDGYVEIGYSIVSTYRRQGFATEAAQGMVQHALKDREVKCVVAHTMRGETASREVLTRSGFDYCGLSERPGVDRYECRRESATGSAAGAG